MEYCFYLDWAGWSPEVWAAWAQAILSAVAIVVAARMATNQDRRARRSRVEGYFSLVSDVQDQVENSYVLFLNLEGYSAPPGFLEKWEETCKRLADIPFHEVPDYRLYLAVRESLDIARSIRDTHRATSEPGSKITSEDIEHIHDCETAMEQVYDDVVKVINELATPTLKQRWNYWRFKERSKERALKGEKAKI
jgi:hypothetical protein